ncbi:hypothetical protein M9H77_06783 [Catharanthus roseus]|uniref:Uncharacterized protein n=1 Tax=Catharanthus roseus TaxID=4058 RepID=A0ACC0BT33_CATRO|nr:hypothetical protein M9H77_06783 [Catharanthus roseus]
MGCSCGWTRCGDGLEPTSGLLEEAIAGLEGSGAGSRVLSLLRGLAGSETGPRDFGPLELSNGATSGPMEDAAARLEPLCTGSHASGHCECLLDLRLGQKGSAHVDLGCWRHFAEKNGTPCLR